jgi:hypothetical protein
MTPVLHTALEGLRLGYSVLAIHAIGEPKWVPGPDGSWFQPLDPSTSKPAVHGPKAPCGTWGEYQQAQAPEAKLRSDLGGDRGSRRGLALVCGWALEGPPVECLEFDDAAAWDAFETAAGKNPVLCGIFSRIAGGYFELSPRRLPHLLYRCADLDGWGVLARRNEIVAGDDGAKRLKVLIETRGPKQLVTIAPTPGTCHPSGRPYVLQSGGLASIETITPAERQALHDLARSFNEVADEPAEERPRPLTPTRSKPDEEEMPGAHFNRVCTIEMWIGMLASWGWQYVGHVGSRSHCWVHPTASTSLSANLTPRNTLIVYSTSTPLKPWTASSPTTHSAFAVFAKITHGGNLSAAARSLRETGYGSRRTSDPARRRTG